MNTNSLCTKLLIVSWLALSFAGPAGAQNRGFQLNRHEPTPAGEWSFGVDHPWYSRTRDFAAGFTLNYGHNPLVYGLRGMDGSFTRLETVIEHLFLGHFDFALSLWDRLTVSVSLPVTLAERGQALAGISPLSGVAFGDPRLGLLIRLYGQPDASAFSLSLGGSLWLPIGAAGERAGDETARVLPKLVLAGLVRDHFRWSLTGGFYYRPDATIGNLADPTGATLGPSLQLGALAQYADLSRRFAVGPELLLYTTVTNGNGFKKDYTSLELLLGGHYNIGGIVQTGLALGIGTLRDPGTPDFRLLFRLAYAPLGDDRDGDGIRDREDACPAARGQPSRNPREHGCPPGDRDRDGVLDHDDLCPDDVQGPRPDPTRRGCPLADHDRDTVPDAVDACPDRPGVPSKDPRKNGCQTKVVIDHGKLIILEPVFFDSNRDTIQQRSYRVLLDVVDVLRLQPELRRISIEGHTDSTGSLEHNMDLSDRRARSVMQFILNRGISPDRLEAHGYGPTRPIASNETPQGRRANRRVEFIILDPPHLGR